MHLHCDIARPLTRERGEPGKGGKRAIWLLLFLSTLTPNIHLRTSNDLKKVLLFCSNEVCHDLGLHGPCVTGKQHYETLVQLLTTDILVPVTMKNAAKCDT